MISAFILFCNPMTHWWAFRTWPFGIRVEYHSDDTFLSSRKVLRNYFRLTDRTEPVRCCSSIRSPPGCMGISWRRSNLLATSWSPVSSSAALATSSSMMHDASVRVFWQRVKPWKRRCRNPWSHQFGFSVDGENGLGSWISELFHSFLPLEICFSLTGLCEPMILFPAKREQPWKDLGWVSSHSQFMVKVTLWTKIGKFKILWNSAAKPALCSGGV